ncbi:MAG: MBL fold metallo-hydrolase, partial [Candidatus Diapherotrites archaeon]|nr:MBL fold metallo-hydrolase [Candidatus Diapherotrites archaeon]
MTFKLIILGTSSSMPTKKRNLTGAAIRYEGNVDLLDCPEGTQKQLMNSSLSAMKVQHILITHWHLDHFLGIYGLLATMVLQDKTTPLTIYGPKVTDNETKKFVDIIKNKKAPFPLEFKEVTKQGKLYSEKNITVETVKLK